MFSRGVVMAYAYAGEGSLDYSVCRYGQSRLLFRGPPRDLSLPFVAALGGTETYGKFIPRPWPDMAEAMTGFRLINFGCLNASADAYLSDPGVIEVAARARAAVIQITGAANLTNKYYSVHPRRNDRFLRARPALTALFPEVDFTNFHFTRHMLITLSHVAPRRFDLVAEELRRTWIARMLHLIAALRVPVLLLHTRVPESRAWSTDPVLVENAMLAALHEAVAGIADVRLSDEARGEGVAGMVFSPLEHPAAEGLPGLMAHHEMAEAVSRGLEQML